MDMFLARNREGVTIHIEEAENGYACNCTCLRCKKPVNARQGPKNTWSFAHIPDQMDGQICSNTNGESDLHKYAKRLFEEKNSIFLPDIHYGDGLPERTNYHPSSKLGQLVPGGKGKDFAVEKVSVEETLHLPSGGTIRPDVLLTVAGKQMAVEIVVSHDIDEEKHAGYVAMKMTVLKIDLHGLILEEMPKAELDELILEKSTRKTWDFNQYAFEENRKREVREQKEREEAKAREQEAAEEKAKREKEAAEARERAQVEAWTVRLNARRQQSSVKEIDKKSIDPAGYLQLNDFHPAEAPYRDWYLEWVPKCTHHERPQRMMLTYSHRTHQFFWSCREYPQCKRTVSVSEKPIVCPRCHKGYVEPVYIDALRRNGFRCSNYRDCTFLFVDPAQPCR